MILKQLIKLANVYDKMGQTKKADRLDAFINKWAQAEKEPTLEDLEKEEDWLKQEGITTDDGEDDGQTYFEEDPLEGLEGDDLEIANNYLNQSTPDIAAMLQDLEIQKNRILEQLGKLQESEYQPEITPLPLKPEASLMRDLEKLATMLDEQKLFKHASFFDGLLTKLAQGVLPDDLFDDTDADDFDMVDEDILPEDDSMMGAVENFETGSIEFLQTLADGEFSSLEEAQDRAKELLAAHKSTEVSEPDIDSMGDMTAEF